MLPVLRSKLGRSLVRNFFYLALPLFFAGWLSLHFAIKALDTQTHQVLRSASDGAEAQLREFLAAQKRTVLGLASSSAVIESLKTNTPAARDLSALLSRLEITDPTTESVLTLDNHGKVAASSSPEMLGRDQSSLPDFLNGRASFAFGDVTRAPDGSLHWRMSAPVKDPATGTSLGVVVMSINPAVLNDLTTGKRILQQGADTQSYRIGNTGETYLVNRNGLMITRSRFLTNAPLTLAVNTEPIKLAAQTGKEMIGDYVDYRGKPVSGASAIIHETGWVLLTEIDFSQVFAPLIAMRESLLGLCILLLIAAAFVIARVSLNIVRPLALVSEADQALASGNERAAFAPEENLPKNEFGDFIRNRNRRIKLQFHRQRELLREQKARAQAAAELEHVSYSMVHDMREPLRAITSFAELVEIADCDQLNEQQRAYLERIKRASRRMDKLICDMIQYSLLLRQEFPLVPVDTALMLEKTIETNATLFEHKEAIDISDQIPRVIGNEAGLMQVFSALLENALKYTRPGETPHVEITGSLQQKTVRICVKDNGPGISPDLQQKLFDIYHRGTSSAGGTGIGLALARVAVERMAGHIGVTSTLGHGCTFWVELKSADAETEEMTDLPGSVEFARTESQY